MYLLRDLFLEVGIAEGNTYFCAVAHIDIDIDIGIEIKMNNSQQNMFHKARYRLAHFTNEQYLQSIPPPLNGHHEDIPLNLDNYRSSIYRDGKGSSAIHGIHVGYPTTSSVTANNPDITLKVPSSLDVPVARAVHHLLKNFDRVLHSELYQEPHDTNDPFNVPNITKVSGHSIIHSPSIKQGRVHTIESHGNISPPDLDNLEYREERGEDLYSPEELEEVMKEHSDSLEDSNGDKSVTVHKIQHPAQTKPEISQLLSRIFGSILLSHLSKTDLPPDPRLDLLEDKGLIEPKHKYIDSENYDLPNNPHSQFKLIKDSTGKHEKQHALVAFAIPLLRSYIDHLLDESPGTRNKLSFSQFINKTRDSYTPLKEVLAEILRKPPRKQDT